MKFLPLLTVAFIALNVAHSNEKDPYPIDKRVETLATFTQEKVDTTWLTDEIRPIIVEQLLSKLSKADREKRFEIERILVTIGHLETIERLAIQMKAGEDCRALEFSAREEAIPALMDVVETGSSLVPGFGGGSDVFTPSVRIQAASILFEVIRSKDVFPEKTKRWFSSLSPLDDSKTGLGNLSRLEPWWKGNQAAIEAHTTTGHDYGTRLRDHDYGTTTGQTFCHGPFVMGTFEGSQQALAAADLAHQGGSFLRRRRGWLE